MGHPKDIFKNRGPLTEQEISDYLNGKLSEKAQRKVELKMAQDEFNMDAMEGFSESGAEFEGFEVARQNFQTSVRKAKKGWQFHHTIILSIILMGGTMFLGPYLFPDHGNTTLPTNQNEDIDSAKNNISDASDEQLLEELSDDEIEASVILDELQIVQPVQVIVESPVVIDSTIANDNEKLDQALQESIEIKKISAKTDLENILVPSSDEIVYSNVPLIYMRNFLLVDYSKIYVDPPTIEKVELFGTSPDLENKEDVQPDGLEDNVQTIIITYKEYLTETQELFEAHKFKSALKRYKVILNKYPDDLNAHFYSGLCYFNIGKYDLAIQHLNVAQKHPYNTFQIDAEWYIAKTYYQQGKTAACKNKLEAIIADGKYYKEQAEKLLMKL